MSEREDESKLLIVLRLRKDFLDFIFGERYPRRDLYLWRPDSFRRIVREPAAVVAEPEEGAEVFKPLLAGSWRNTPPLPKTAESVGCPVR